MADDRQDDAHRDDNTELAEEARAAISTLEQDDPSPEIRELLRTPQGRETFEKVAMMVMAVSEEQHSGPLPAPRQMREYEATVPGAAERIMQWPSASSSTVMRCRRAMLSFAIQPSATSGIVSSAAR